MLKAKDYHFMILPILILCDDTLRDSQSSEIISKWAISFSPSLEEKKKKKKSWVWWSFLFQSQMMCACRQHPLITLVALMFTCASEFPGKWVKTQSSRFRRHREGFGCLYFYQVPERLQCIPKMKNQCFAFLINHLTPSSSQGRKEVWGRHPHAVPVLAFAGDGCHSSGVPKPGKGQKQLKLTKLRRSCSTWCRHQWGHDCKPGT